jgi:hypothetical protein
MEASSSDELASGLGGNAMSDWKADLERLVENTTAFEKRIRVQLPMPRTIVEPDRKPVVNWMESEREEKVRCQSLQRSAGTTPRTRTVGCATRSRLNEKWRALASNLVCTAGNTATLSRGLYRSGLRVSV